MIPARSWEATIKSVALAAASATKQHIIAGQVTIAKIIISVVALVLIVTALVLAWDARKAFRQPEVVEPIKVSANA